jgi:DNA helicase-2/ATP-dependent DNA helicase PcrA
MSRRLDYRSELNPEQVRAVETTDGPLLIIAGAGSGKTRVITYRIAHMLEQGVPQSAILALTFTNKAAREMRERVKELTGRPLKNLTCSTFHAFGVKVLRSHIHLLGYRENFSIYDTQDQLSLLKETAREIKFTLDPGELKWLLAEFSRIRTGRAEWDEELSRYRELFGEYREHMKVYNAVDFDDLILLPVEIMERYPEVRAGLEAQYRYLLVDEFQDTSGEQYRFLKLLSEKHRNVCVVGDDDQSIYSWRGANFGNLLDFETDFPERAEIKLERNYRSTDTILAAANRLISNNSDRKHKELWTGMRGGRPIELHFPADEREEAQFIAEKVKSLAQRESIRYEDMGVLVRTNSLVRHIEEAFLTENIPYRVSGGQSFFQRKEVRDIISYLRVMANHDDDISLLRIINTPRRGVGKKTLEELNRLARDKGLSVYSAIQEAVAAEHPKLPAKGLSDLGSFVELIESYRDAFFASSQMAEVLSALISEIEYWGHLVQEYQQNERAATAKYRNVQFLVEFIRDYENDPDVLEPSLFDYLNRISLQVKDNLDDEEAGGRVGLMTIHAAKGLERRVIFLAGVEDDIIPHARALEDAERNIEEERRLFYVAITRAREQLYMTSCLTRRVMREQVECRPSRFLEEIPEDLITQSEPEEVVGEEEAADFFAAMKAKFTPK